MSTNDEDAQLINVYIRSPVDRLLVYRLPQVNWVIMAPSDDEKTPETSRRTLPPDPDPSDVVRNPIRPTGINISIDYLDDEEDVDGNKINYRKESTPNLTDSPLGTPRKTRSGDGPSFFFNRLTMNRRASRSASMRSVRSSVTSIDTLHLQMSKEENLVPPSCEAELLKYVRDLADTYKKTSHLKEVLMGSWVRQKPNLKCSDDVGNTILHAAARLGEYKVISALGHFKPEIDMDIANCNQDTALHLAAEYNEPQAVESLLKHGANKDIKNEFRYTPIQVAAIKCNYESLESLLKYGADYTVITENNETVLHLACRGILWRYLDIKDRLDSMIQREEIGGAHSAVDKRVGQITLNEFVESLEQEKQTLLQKSFPVLNLLLYAFQRNAGMIELEDLLPTSPGTILHYFCTLDYVYGVRRLMEEPFLVSTNLLNKNGISPLWIAAWYNNNEIGIILLRNGADPNHQDKTYGMTPLHCAIYGFHGDRADPAVEFIDELLMQGANPKIKSKAGETPPHLVMGTHSFQIMSKFIDYLGPEILELRDETGNTFFHYAVGCLDENTIFKLMERGASLMCRNCLEVIVPESDEDSINQVTAPERVDPLVFGFNALIQSSRVMEETKENEMARALLRGKSQTVYRLPLQEAMKLGNSTNYFNALRRLDFKEVLANLTPEEGHQFLCFHLIAATREVRPDIVRMLFQQIQDVVQLHKTLLFCDKSCEDYTFTKTALEWAVENNDRLCTTEILHQEFECHRNSKEVGLSCLRRQLTGDELLIWTIETFTMFYEKTWAQRCVIPVMGLIPLYVSIFSFIYDYYSDIELTIEYYKNAFRDRVPDLTSATVNKLNVTKVFCEEIERSFNAGELQVRVPAYIDIKNCSEEHFGELFEDTCSEGITRTPEEYRTAFVVNIVCISFPLLVFFFMCSRELLPLIRALEDKIYLALCFPVAVVVVVLVKIAWILVSLLCSPFFILFVGARQVYYKFRHRRAKRKNKFRRKLQESEYYWGISRTAEAGLESCGQLILQVWLLSSQFYALSSNSFPEIADKTYNGIIFFLSFSIKEADDVEKSLGKVLMSLVTLVFGISACYRTLKRGAVQMKNTIFIYFSLLLQVVARMFSIGLFFLAVRSFWPTVPLLLALHFFFVMIIKWSSERARYSGGKLSWLVATVNVFASSLVFVRINPIERSDPKCNVSHFALVHSTFFVQSLFFFLVFIENLLLASAPLYLTPNRGLLCIGEAKLQHYLGFIVLFSMCSWMCHIIYYKFMGHPWADINGPEFSSSHLKFTFFCCGKERLFSCECEDPRADEDDEFTVPKTRFKTLNISIEEYECQKLTDDLLLR